jgi:DNA mismatch endonuclease (patch repair protein)
MSDVFTKAKRSEVMSRIRSRGNKDTELALAKLFRRHGITGWRRQTTLVVRSSRREEAHSSIRKSVRASSPRLLRVKVDFVFRQLQLALFVDGCFWHGCPKHETKPKNNRAFWQRKLSSNKARDRLVTRTLRRANWRVLRIWEHELAKKNEARLVKRLKFFLKKKERR